MSREQTLEERKEVYGEYGNNVEALAKIMETLNKLHASAHGSLLNEKDRANLSYVVIKLIRLGVTPNHIDSWHDLGNYAHLSEEFYSSEPTPKVDFSCMAKTEYDFDEKSKQAKEIVSRIMELIRERDESGLVPLRIFLTTEQFELIRLHTTYFCTGINNQKDYSLLSIPTYSVECLHDFVIEYSKKTNT